MFIHFPGSSVSSDFGRRAQPNKAPEPTACSVTPRAIEGEAEMKQQKESRSAARVAPEHAVAHL